MTSSSPSTNMALSAVRPLALAFVTLLLVFAIQSEGHSRTAQSTTAVYFPPAGSGWESVIPADLGWDTVALDQAVSFAGEHRSTALLVVHRGRIVVERYWDLEDPRSYTRLRDMPPHPGATADGGPIEDVGSVQKGVLGLLVGLAEHRSLVDIDAPVSSYLGEGWTQATPAQEELVTVRHLMSMSSGLTRDLRYEAAPDQHWYYNTQVYSRLFDVLTQVSGQAPNDYTNAWLTQPLGMRDTRWALRDGGPNRYGLTTSARDLARMGLLMLTRGVWNGRRLVDDDVMGAAFESSQSMNPAYGLLWWVNGESHWDDWTNTGRMRSGSFIPTAPDDLIAARGIGDRKIYVVPSLDLVVTRLGGFALHDADDEPDRQFFDHQFWKRLMRALP